MSNKVKPIPEAFHTVTPYLTVQGGAKAIDFYKRAFGAQERYRLPGPDGQTIGHAELVIGNSIVMLADACPAWGNKDPQALGGTPVGFALYVEDADSAFHRAVAAGAKVKQPLELKFYGDRAGTVEDPFGHQWTLMTHVEDVPPVELNRRLQEMYAKMGAEKT